MLANSSKKLEDNCVLGDLCSSDYENLELFIDKDPNQMNETDKKLLEMYKTGY